MVTGGFRTRTICEAALDNQELDFVGFGRPFIEVEEFPNGFLDGSLDKAQSRKIPVLDKKNQDAAEAGFYDLLISRIATGKSITKKYSALRVALHIGMKEMRLGLRNKLLRR